MFTLPASSTSCPRSCAASGPSTWCLPSNGSTADNTFTISSCCLRNVSVNTRPPDSNEEQPSSERVTSAHPPCSEHSLSFGGCAWVRVGSCESTRRRREVIELESKLQAEPLQFLADGLARLPGHFGDLVMSEAVTVGVHEQLEFFE